MRFWGSQHLFYYCQWGKLLGLVGAVDKIVPSFGRKEEICTEPCVFFWLLWKIILCQKKCAKRSSCSATHHSLLSRQCLQKAALSCGTSTESLSGHQSPGTAHTQQEQPRQDAWKDGQQQKDATVPSSQSGKARALSCSFTERHRSTVCRQQSYKV